MRTIVLVPLILISVAAGCGPDPTERASGSVAKRDLTLVTQTLEVKTASQVEVQPVRMPVRTLGSSRPAARRAPVPRSTSLESKPRPVAVTEAAPISAAIEPAVQPVSTPSSPGNDRELLPGKTVTLIPASSGPSPSPDVTEELPEARGRTLVTRGGGKCGGRGRGPGIGISTAPRPDFR